MNDTINHETVMGNTSPHSHTDWRIGKVLLNEYIIVDILGTGGMGKVFLVEPYRFSGSPLAVKTLKTSFTADHQQKRLFMNELRTWSDLPEHPFISSFRFFRTIEDRTAIFSEYVNGGSLDRWIHDGKLLAIDSILDVAIQLAWGLYAAHENGVIHQDVKPANVLMTRDGIVKITDFGLANACNVSGVIQDTPSDSSKYLVSCKGMTFAYSSPEQTAQERLTIRSDIWSYGLTVFQMFTGKVTWKFGLMAQQLLADHIRKQGVPPYPAIPPALVEVLGLCFRENPKERWLNMKEIAERLMSIYGKIAGHDYPRPMPSSFLQSASADSGHTQSDSSGTISDLVLRLNVILSEFGLASKKLDSVASDLGLSPKTRAIHELQLFEEVLDMISQIGDTGHSRTCAQLLMEKAKIHKTLGDRPGELDALDTATRLLLGGDRSRSDRPLTMLIARACFMKAETYFDLRRYSEANETYDQVIAYLNDMEGSGSEVKPDFDLARVYTGKANALLNLRNSREALDYLNRSIALRDAVIGESADAAILGEHAQTLMYKSAVLDTLGKNPEAIECADLAIRILNRCIGQANSDRLQLKLAQFFLGKANLLHAHGHADEAIGLMDQALSILERIKNKAEIADPDMERAKITMNKAIALWTQGNFREALDNYSATIETRERLIHYQGRRELEQDLAKAYMNKANAMVVLGDQEESLVFFDRCIAIRTRLVQEDKHLELEPSLATAYMNKAACLALLHRNDEALQILGLSLGIFERLVYVAGKVEMEGILSSVYLNTGIVFNALDRNAEAIAMYDRSVAITERLMLAGRGEFAIPLAKCLLNKTIALREENRLSEALEACEKSNALRKTLIERDNRRELLGDLAWGLLDRMDILVLLGESPPEKEIRSAIGILRTECERTGRADLTQRLQTAERKFRNILIVPPEP